MAMKRKVTAQQVARWKARDKAKKSTTTTWRPRRPKNVRVARIEMQCVRCRRMIQPGKDIYLLASTRSVLSPDTPVACSQECHERWQETTAPATTTGTTRQKPIQAKAIATRVEVRDGVEFTVYVLPEKRRRTR
jgi:hypothetical protein